MRFATLAAILLSTMSQVIDADDASSQLFEQRLRPILKSDAASSCTECHFSGVELRHYLRNSEAETFATLRQRGLIDSQRPEKSKLLEFIARKPDKSNPLTEKVRQTELAAFREWITAAVRNPELLKAKPSEPLETELSVEVIRHARRDRVLASFVDNVWSEMGRCLSCHSPEKNRHQVAKRGLEFVDSISWLVPRDPAATLERLVADGDIDLDHPEASPLLTKPAGLVEHGGGPKFLAGGETYAKFLAFLKDYAAVRNGSYQQPADLPKPATEMAWLTAQHLKLTDLPETALEGMLKGDVYRWDDRRQTWASQRAGFVEGPANAKQRVFHNMVSQTVPADDRAAVAELRRQPRLPAGRYLVRLSI
ncbi:MAG TPA: hypothetical protein VM165_26145, partial [Planctomycetaceae bacterium]|nr:hypothetical protein [Planctomycetaceae bacterium]